MSENIEHKAVEIGEIKGGVKLKAGHRTIVIVNGAQGNARYGKFEGQFDEEADDPNADKPGQPKKKKHTWESQAAEAGEPAPGTVGGIDGAEFEIHVQLTAAGGTPLAAEKVLVIDPLTEEQIGSPAVTDEKGILRARVPEQKEYLFLSAAEGKEERSSSPWSDLQPPHVAGDEHSVLFVALAGADGSPLKGEKVSVKGEAGDAQEMTTDDLGHIRLVTEPGVYQLELKGKSFVAHTLFSSDLGEEARPYKFSLS
jgi:hypothetical protein